MATVASSDLEAENGGGIEEERGQADVGDLNETLDNNVQSFDYYLTKTSDLTRCTSTPQDGKVISTLASPPFQVRKLTNMLRSLFSIVNLNYRSLHKIPGLSPDSISLPPPPGPPMTEPVIKELSQRELDLL